MRDKLIRFIDNTIGNFQEVSDETNRNQCMDLAYEWVFCLDVPKSTIQHQFAYEVYTQATEFTRQYFDIIPNLKETIPQAGDLAVFKGGEAGHIAIVVEATQSSMKLYEQNNPLGTNASLHDRGYTNCLGFLRPKISNTKVLPQWFENLLTENNLNIENEGKIREFIDKAVKYDGDVKSYQEQIKSVNEALADRAREVSVLIEKNQKLSDKVDETKEEINLVRSKNDTLSWENTQLEIQNEELASKCTSLEEQVTGLQSKKPLYGYSWFTRFKSLFKRA